MSEFQIYETSEKVKGSRLSPGMWLDSLDHRGARAIKSIEIPGPDMDAKTDSELRHVRFWWSGDTEVEVVRADMEYDVVDPDSLVEWTS